MAILQHKVGQFTIIIKLGLLFIEPISFPASQSDSYDDRCGKVRFTYKTFFVILEQNVLRAGNYQLFPI